MAQVTDSGTTGNFFVYMSQSVESSLFRNGKVLARRDDEGTTKDSKGFDVSIESVNVHNARHGVAVGDLAPQQRGIFAAHGFELFQDPLQRSGFGSFDFKSDNARIMSEYYPHCAELVKRTTGATHVFAFDHNIRTSDAGKISIEKIGGGGNAVQGPATIVHGDYTLTSAPQRLLDLGEAPKINDTYRDIVPEGQPLLDPAIVQRALAPGGRFAIINVWRNIRHEPVLKTPLALCSGQSVSPNELVTFEIHYDDRIGENYMAKQDQNHAWYFYPRMTRDEALLIKQWDSTGALARSKGTCSDAGDADCTFSFHTAFKEECEELSSPERESIEVRTIAIWADGPDTPSKL